ncbi:MAG: lipoprotein-releasing ABC transporter permease subunit [Gammaproteobacteria bacterium]
MFRPVALYIGLRYTRAKRRNHFISFISLASMIGIALGVTVLITVLSVMNGFDEEIKHRIFDMARQVTVSTYDGVLPQWQTLQRQLARFPNIVAVAPFVNGQGILTNQGVSQPILVTGVLPNEETQVSQLPSKMVQGFLSALRPGEFGIVIGKNLAQQLGLKIGDKVPLFVPKASVTPAGMIVRFKRFTIVGLFNVGGGFGFDTGMAMINLQDAQVLYELGDSVSGLRLKVPDLYTAPKVASKLQNSLSEQYTVSDWTQEYGTFFKAIRMEKSMMFFILVLIIAVAAFNLVSSLVMIVTDKRSEIAILRTLGASPREIMATFMVQGCIIGIVGTLLGVIGGVLLALNATTIVAHLQDLLHVQFISANVYFIDFLPSHLQWSDVWRISVIALALSLLATLYPAWQAARTQPAEALRYE